MRNKSSHLPLKKVKEIMLLCIGIAIILFIGLNYSSHFINFLRLMHEPSKWVTIVSGVVVLLSAILVILKPNLKKKHSRMIIKIGVWSSCIMIISLCIMSSYTLIINPPPLMYFK
ncbi:hypothetical protein ACJQ7K_002337 [Staphylococcus aureus]